MGIKRLNGRNRARVARNRVFAERSPARSRRRSLAIEPLEQRVLLDAGGILSGTVFDDADRNGVFDVGEPGLADWTVELQPVGSTDTPELILENPTPDQWSQFGRFVAAVGDNVLVGSHYDDASGMADAGAAYLFDGSTGELLHTLLSPDPREGDKFGRAVAGLGDDVLVGAPLDDTVAEDSGAVYLFDGESGDLLRSFPNPTFGINDQFGRAVAAVGSNVLVGARFDDAAADNGSIEDAGAAYLLDSETGELLHTLLSPTPADNAQFGYSVAAMGENVLIGARYDETGAAGVGAVYLFDGHTGNLLQVFRNPTQRASGDPSGFGRSVAAVGDNVLVGARLDDSGVDGGGSAFLFHGATGEVLHVLTSPTPFAGEEFGFCVAGLGGDVLIGARWDNRWDGLNDDSGGAAYLFDGVTGQLLQTFANPSPAGWDAFGISITTLDDQIVVGAQDGNAVYLFDAAHEASTARTDADGRFAFDEPQPGTYRVLNRGREGFVQTLPDDGGTYTVEIGESGNVVDLDFGYVENDRPTGRNDVYDMIEDGILIVPAAEGVLANDTDPDGDELTPSIVNTPRYGSLSLSADGSFTYTPDRDFFGSDGFTYRADDGLAGSNLVSVTITVDPVNDAPVAGDNGLWTLINTPRTVEAPGLLADDSDPDGDTLTALLADPPLNGTVAIEPDGSYTYTPNPDYTGDDRFTYRADDGTAASNVATVRVTVSINTIDFLKDYLRISEVNYHPHGPTPAERALGLTDVEAFEFIELHNTRNAMLDLRGVKLTGAVEFEFEFVAETIVEAGQYALLVKDRAAFEARYGTQHNVVGQYTGDMHNNGDQIVLKDPFDRTILDFSYDDEGPWPRWADGFGSTLEVVTINQDYGAGMNWRASATYGGSPMSDGNVPRSVVINEVLSHSNLPLTDTIELYNTADEPIDIGGWFLSESANDFKKFRIPDGTIIAADGYVVFDEYDFNPGRWEPGSGGFALNSSDGDDIWLTAADGEGNLTQFVDHLEFGAALRDQAFGRWPNGTGELFPMRGRTFGSPNSHPRVGSIIISEIMYHPVAPGGDVVGDDLEYIELFNVTTEAIDLRHWRIRGGITFEFPNHYDSEVPVFLEPGESVLVVGFDGYDAGKLDAFREFYSITDPIRMFGPYEGNLNDGGDRIRLMRPDAPAWWEPHKIPRVLEELVVYDNEAPWSESADGENDALHRRAIDLWSNAPSSWIAALPSPGAVDFQTGNVAIAEINYHPHEPTDAERIVGPGLTGDDFEFIEIVNVAGKPVELGGYRLSGGVAFDMPDVTLATGQRAVIVSNQVAFELRYGSQINVLGAFTGTLSNRGEQITLVGSLGQSLFTFSYADKAPWPVRADGAGSTLELIDAWGGYGDGTNWRRSVEYGGSPGRAGLSPIGEVVVNEILLQTGNSSGDRIELYNAVGGPIDIGGWYLSNSGANPEKFRIPDNTIIGPYGYVVFESEQGQLPIDGPGFALDPYSPNSVFLLTTDAAGNVMHFADQADIGPTTTGESWGRWPNGHGKFYPMVTTTLNPESGDNSGPRVGPVVISELMYHPRDPGDLVKANDLEYIEIYNPTKHPVNLTGWKLSDGVTFEFAKGARLAPREAMLVVRFDPADAELLKTFRRHYGIKPWVDIVGGYAGSLSNQGDRVRLLRAGQSPPEDPGLVPMLFEDEVIYDDEAPWPITADGFGHSLTRIDVAGWGNDVTNWTAVPPLPGMVEPRVDKLAITELNYQPHAPTAAELAVDPNFTHDDFEFIELLNVSGGMLDLAGMQFVEGVAFAFADVILAPAQRVLIVRNPTAFHTRYDVDETIVVGRYEGDLSDLGEQLTLVDASGETIMRFTYETGGDWPTEAAGQGSSLEILDLAGYFNDPDNWRAGSEFGGSPGVLGAGPQRDVLINEVLANSETPAIDLIELINNTGVPIDVGGWYLSDSAADYRKFRIPDATVIPARGYLVFDQTDVGFDLDGSGGQVSLLEGSGGELVRFADRVQYGHAAVGKSFGRWPNGQGEFLPLVRPTLDRDNPQHGANRPAQMADSLVITELNYHSTDFIVEDPDPLIWDYDFDFIELQNASPFPFDLTGFRIGGGITFDFTNDEVTELAPWEYVVVVANRPAFEARYGTDNGILVAGQFERDLSNGGEQITLTDQAGANVFDFTYDDDEEDGWPWMADGNGATLELIDPTLTPPPGPARTEFLEDGGNWRSSGRYGGSPGAAGAEPLTGVVINEVLAGGNAPLNGLAMIELFNGTQQPIDISGWHLTNDADDWGKYTIPDGTTIPDGGYLALIQSLFGFTIDTSGEELYLLTGEEDGAAPLLVDGVDFGPAGNNESLGRWPDGEGHLYPMRGPTMGFDNVGPRVGPLVISELHYNSAEPDGRDNLEFIEIYNPTQSTVDLAGWEIDGGIDYWFRDATLLPPESTLVVLSFDPDDPAVEDRLVNFRETYAIEPSTMLVGPYAGRLSNGGETVQLIRHGGKLEDEVAYDDHAPWSIQADGRGRSLHRREEDLWGDEPESWMAAAPSPGQTDLTPAKVVGRHIFYNDSRFDPGGPNADVQDDDAIASNKEALMPGQTASLANYTSYDRGINGMMIDIADLSDADRLDASDFEFKVGNSDDVQLWTTGPEPSSVVVRPGAGVDGSDRVTLLWADNAIEKQWLQVTVSATENTGLRDPDVFYFGNAVGEGGDQHTHAITNATDEIDARNSIHGPLNPAHITDNFDYNRDRLVNGTDQVIARNNQTSPLTALRLIAAPAADAVIEQMMEQAEAAAKSPPRGLDWPYDQEINVGNRLGTIDLAITMSPPMQAVIEPLLITVGDHVLLADTPGQEIQIFVTGGDDVQGLNLNVMIADGGPALGGTITGPTIEDIDVQTGTIFADNNSGQMFAPEPTEVPQWEGRTIVTASGTVSADGLLATITIDTTGFMVGAWDLVVSETLGYKSDFAGIIPSVIDGHIIIETTNTAPTAVDDDYTIAEGGTLTVPVDGVLANDTDPESDPIHAEPVGGPAHGTLVIEEDGSFVYTPDALFNGTDSFTYYATDDINNSNVATVTITIDPVNDVPIVVTPIPDVTVGEDAADTVVDLSGVFDDVDLPADTLTLSVTSNTNLGLVSASLVGTDLTLAFATDQHGTADVTIRATDAAGDWVEETFTVTVSPVNDVPVAVTPISDVTVGEDAADTVVDLSGVLDDVDLPADTLTLLVAGNTNVGLVSTSLVGTNLTLAFAADRSGTANVTIRATDAAGDWVEETLTVTVSPVNDEPVAVTPISDVTVGEDAADTVVDLSGVFDDVDLPTDTLTLSVAGNTNLGLVSTSLVGTDLTLAFATDQHGTADVTIRATDAAGDWVEETLTVTVNPVADIELLGTVDFLEIEGLDPSSGDLWYQLATTRAGYLTLEALTDGATLTLYDSSRNEMATSALINGKQRIDVVADAADEVYHFKLSGGGSDVDVRVTNLVLQDSGQVTVFGTASDDRFEMVAAASDVGINDVWYNFNAAQAATVTFDGSHGNNTAMIHGTVGTESANLWADRAEIDGDGYKVIIDNVASTTVDGLGGEDHATFYDSDADDELTVWPTGGLMLSDTISHRVDNFENVVAFATAGGVDVVKFYDSPGNDDYVGTPIYNGLSGDGFDHEVWFFEASHTYATAGGIDVAKLYDSTGDDTYVSSPTDASLFNPDYQNDEMARGFLSRVKFFEGVHAYATAGGVDTARLYDSSGDDLFYADATHGALYNTTYQEKYTNGFYNRAKYFEEVTAFADTGGRDVALLNGSPENDVFQSNPTVAVLFNPTYQESYTNGFLHRAKAFDEVYCTAGEGDDDQAYLDDVPSSIDLLTGEADHIRLTNETLDILYEAAGFDYVKAKTADEGDTKDLPDPGLLQFILELEGPWQE